MNKLKVLLVLFIALAVNPPAVAQPYYSHNMRLLAQVNPNNDPSNIGPFGRYYMGCYGWAQTDENREYAIAGASNGVYFIDVTDPARSVVSAFVPGKNNCGWREIKTYKNYCYVCSDDPAPNEFMIIDMSHLPGSAAVVHRSDSILQKGHTLFIENDKLYVSAVTYKTPGKYSTLNVYSLADPARPLLLRSLEQDFSNPDYVHDVFVRHDTIFASCGPKGMYIFRFDVPENRFKLIGSYYNYGGTVSNHSSSGTGSGKYLVFTDENPGTRVKLVNTADPENMRPVSEFLPFPNSTAHNPYVLGNNWAIISCYQDGVFMYDISDPAKPALAGYFDTSPQFGDNAGKYDQNYSIGNWGAYPFLPSGILIACDSQNGIFVLDVSETINYKNPDKEGLFVYPNPAAEKVRIHSNREKIKSVKMTNTSGETLFEKKCDDETYEVNTSLYAPGEYLITVSYGNQKAVRKLIIRHN